MLINSAFLNASGGPSGCFDGTAHYINASTNGLSAYNTFTGNAEVPGSYTLMKVQDTSFSATGNGYPLWLANLWGFQLDNVYVNQNSKSTKNNEF